MNKPKRSNHETSPNTPDNQTSASISNHVGKVQIELPPPKRVSSHAATTMPPKPQEDATAVGDKKRKEPKFVPYEPYRAAVVPIVTKKPTPRKPAASNRSAPDSSPKGKPDRNSNKGKASDCNNIAKVMPLVLRTSSKEDATEVSQLKRELEAAKSESRELQDQLSQQTKINTELKKLLVASVGEDLETRLQFLTHDKVKLAHDVNHYVQRLLADHEELEKLSIQCDVWRSKFLASSLIVDGLANWKAVLYHRYDDALDTLQHLLEEHNKIYENLDAAVRNLKATQDACHRPTHHEQTGSAKSVLDMATLCNNLSSQLTKSLSILGTSVASEKHERAPTAGEKHAAQVLRGPSLYDPPADYLKTVKPESCSLHSSIVHRFYPDTRFEHLTMNCCSHCSGEIQLL